MDNFAYGALTLSGRSFQDLSAIILHRLFSPNPGCKHPVWALPRSLAATYGITVVFSSSGYLDVSVHRVPSTGLCIQHVVTGVFPAGLPHSDICGSQCICHSPQLFAAYHVFHRLLVPRHPPCALHSLTIMRNAYFGHTGWPVRAPGQTCFPKCMWRSHTSGECEAFHG